MAATFGLTLLMQTSALAFWVVKLLGAGYLVWLGIKVLRSRSLVSFAPAARQPLRTIFATGLSRSTGATTTTLLAGVLGYAALTRMRPDRQFWHDAVCGTRLIDWRPVPRPKAESGG